MKEKDKLSYKITIYGSWFMAIGVPLGMLAWAYFNGQIKQADQLFKWLSIIGIIIGTNVGQYFFSKKHDDFNRNNQNKLNSEEAKKARIKWAIIVSPVIFFGLILTIGQLDYEDYLERTESSGLLFLYGFLGIYLIYKFCVKLSPQVKNYVSPVTYWAVYFFVFMLYFFSIPMTIAHLNVTDSEDNIEIKRSILFNGEWVGMNDHRRYCYDLKHWDSEEEFGSVSFCTNEYPRIKEGYEVELVVKKGELGFLYIDEIIFPSLKSFETYISSIEGEESLRYADVWQIDKLKGRNYHYHISKHWGENCNDKTPYKCRLASYLFSIVNQKDKAIELLKKGCSYNEFVSCSGLYLYTPKGTEEKKTVTKKILKFCEDLSKLPKDSKNTCDWLKKESKNIL